MTSLLEIPNYELAAKSLHSTSHGVVDSTPGYICTETSSNTSFTENNILRVKEIRCDRNGGNIRTTGIIISNKNQVQAGQVVPDSAIYDNVGGFTTAQIVTFDNTINNSALVVRSGGAYIGDGAIVVGTVTANQLNVNGTSSFTGLMTFNGGLSGNFQYQTITATTRINTPETDNGTDANVNYKRNGNTVFSLGKTTQTDNTTVQLLTLPTDKYLKLSSHPRFFATKQAPNTSKDTNFAASGTTLFSSTGVIVNHGNNFDPATGSFTAPVSGNYLVFFHASGYNTAKSNTYLTSLLKNGTTFGINSNSQNATGNATVGFDIIVNLVANDSIRLVNSGDAGVNYNIRYFFGCMLVHSL